MVTNCKSFIISIFLMLTATLVMAQKKQLDHSVYDQWEQVSDLNISSAGKYLWYERNPQEGDGELIIRDVRSRKEIKIPRGHRAVITENEQYVICLIKPFHEDYRRAKIKKLKSEQMPKDSVAIISLKNNRIEKHPEIRSYKIPQKGSRYVAIHTSDTTLMPKQERKNNKIGNPLLIFDLVANRVDTLPHVEMYRFDLSGNMLATVVNTKEKKSKAKKVEWLDLSQHKTIYTSAQSAFYTLPTFNDESTEMLFLSSADTLSSGSKQCGVYKVAYQNGILQVDTLLKAGSQTHLPQGWGVNEHANPYFSQDGKNIFVGMGRIIPPKDTSIISFETAELDIWNYADDELPPMQLANLKSDIKKTALAIYQKADKSLLPIATSFYQSCGLPQGANGNVALVVDREASIKAMQWDIQNVVQLFLVSLESGQRTKIASGKLSSAHISPAGKYVSWFNLEDSQWYLHDIASSQQKVLTANMGVPFFDEEDDMPQLDPPYGYAGWTENDEALLLYDRYDIWAFPSNGKPATNITGGYGRDNHLRFRYQDVAYRPSSSISTQSRPRFAESISLSSKMLLSVFGYQTKENGFATIQWGKKNRLKIELLSGHTYAHLKKAEKAPVFTYTKSNYNITPNAYVTDNYWHTEQQMSDINKQMSDYQWGSVEPFSWKAYDGTPLEGLLYKPENFDSNGKYPVIVYFYEKSSHRLYQHYMPAPSASIVNIPLYVSRGYVVFVPDIVYKDGYPGESAYNCIVSGTEALAQNRWVDKERIGIQGQSWGGYQVSYLITRTNMFRCAEAGAPVSNMTSAYGGIRWTTGMSRQFQYEQTQSRIGKTLWEDVELYLKNSPLFYADKVETPLLIMHNDGDGAVPWYQGIEYFMALRRLGKPVWMLQYNKEEHNLMQRRNRKDLSVRMLQFFDYYLQDAPMPVWMKKGIPAWRKGQYLGVEYVE